MSQTETTGVALTAVTVGQGVTGVITQNVTLINLGLTALSCLGGLVFLFLNWRQNKRRTDLLVQEHAAKNASAI